MLKAFVDPQAELPWLCEVQANPDPGPDETMAVRVANAANLTIEGELNKLAANIAIGRNGAGVHYRTEYTKPLALGEAVAVAMLQENALTFADVDPDRVWTLPTFDGHWICIDAKGRIERCPRPERSAAPARTRSLFAD
jgi:hypothetical protein